MSNATETNQVGALWKHKSKSGQYYYTGDVLGQRVVMFTNNSNNPSAPAFTFKLSEEREGD